MPIHAAAQVLLREEAKRIYAIDIVGEIIAKLGASKPAYFQRDGRLFIVSESGFGRLGSGLSTDASLLDLPEYRHKERPMDLEEVRASTDAVEELDSNFSGYHQKVKFAEGEERYIAPIWFRRDSQSFSLRDMVKTAGWLTKLPNDGKIRLINHSSRYHSHKYGYAADGEDVWLASARVMGREKYLDLFRKKEDLSLGVDCVIVTPNLRASFPAIVEVRYDSDGDLKIGKGCFDIAEKSPFGVYLITERQKINAKDAKTFENLQATRIARLQKDLDAIASSMPQIEEYISQTDEAYQKIQKSREVKPLLVQR